MKLWINQSHDISSVGHLVWTIVLFSGMLYLQCKGIKSRETENERKFSTGSISKAIN